MNLVNFNHKIVNLKIECMRFKVFLISIVCLLMLNLPGNAQERILQFDINSTGNILNGRDTIAADQLANYISDRLFKSWSGTGKTYTKIRLTGQDNVLPFIKEGILEEIRNGQQLALKTFVLELHKTNFEKLETKKQEKLREKFPVLFQTSY